MMLVLRNKLKLNLTPLKKVLDLYPGGYLDDRGDEPILYYGKENRYTGLKLVNDFGLIRGVAPNEYLDSVLYGVSIVLEDTDDEGNEECFNRPLPTDYCII